MKNYLILGNFNFNENIILRHLSNEEPVESSHYSDFEFSYKNNEDIPSDDDGIEEASFYRTEDTYTNNDTQFIGYEMTEEVIFEKTSEPIDSSIEGGLFEQVISITTEKKTEIS